MRSLTLALALTVVVGLAFAQFVQPDLTNPPHDPSASFQAVANPSPHVVAILSRACRDCHSHQTVWPWYSRISPVSWMMASDVNDGRARLNFSQWNIYSPDASKTRLREVCEEVTQRRMPLPRYTSLHPNARLTAEDRQAVC